MPATALAWVHALLAILLKYRGVAGLSRLAGELLATAGALRRLSALLRQADRARALVVTRPAELPRLETVRLLAGLRRLGIAVGAVLVNAVGGGTCAACRARAAGQDRAIARIAGGLPRPGRPALLLAAEVAPPPRGARGLAAWAGTWTAAQAPAARDRAGAHGA
jgi:hypothetical protein